MCTVLTPSRKITYLKFLKQRSAKYRLQAKFTLLPAFVNSFMGTQPHSFTDMPYTTAFCAIAEVEQL